LPSGIGLRFVVANFEAYFEGLDRGVAESNGRFLQSLVVTRDKAILVVQVFTADRYSPLIGDRVVRVQRHAVPRGGTQGVIVEFLIVPIEVQNETSIAKVALNVATTSIKVFSPS